MSHVFDAKSFDCKKSPNKFDNLYIGTILMQQTRLALSPQLLSLHETNRSYLSNTSQAYIPPYYLVYLSCPIGLWISVDSLLLLYFLSEKHFSILTSSVSLHKALFVHLQSQNWNGRLFPSHQQPHPAEDRHTCMGIYLQHKTKRNHGWNCTHIAYPLKNNSSQVWNKRVQDNALSLSHHQNFWKSRRTISSTTHIKNKWIKTYWKKVGFTFMIHLWSSSWK